MEACHKELGLGEWGCMAKYTERHLEGRHREMLNLREQESLDVQFAYLTVSWLFDVILFVCLSVQTCLWTPGVCST